MWGQGLSQEDFMIKDECILLDNDDNIVGHGNKKISHTFTPENPRALVHRAFSVFLFNEEGKLLLQKRAADKITFPDVWTNTCCSHPLYGFEPNEIDLPEHVANGSVPGVKNAAIRKLEHELGIATSNFKPEDFKFLTRLHYWAADVVTHGEKSRWGEHEIDYILFVKKNIPLSDIHPHPEEVSDAKYVSHEELKAMMADPSLLWSPWFRIIAERFLIHWWKDLNVTLTTDKYVDVKTIYRFDPTEEHMGGAGDARVWFGRGQEYNPDAVSTPAAAPKEVKKVGDKSLKQGAYGKVKIHKHSTLSQLSHFDEVFAVSKLLLAQKLNPISNVKYDEADPKYQNKEYLKSLQFCNDILGKVSRSFAEVIRQLPKHLSVDIMIFYLALRALDTIEDDMNAFDKNADTKIHHLSHFYQTGLVTEGWHMEGVGEADEKRLLEEYYHVVRVFKALPIASQEVIADITHRMGVGMASFVGRDLGQGTVTMQDYNLYCHYVAGLVGEGLSRLFACTKYESEEVNTVSKTLANTMGLFLQKTNIIRDYLEDFVDERSFWPQEIWKRYTNPNENESLGVFAQPENQTRAVHCLNHMITDALFCIPECLQYMQLLKTQEIFQFCAIPQVMAIATLSELYNNPKVFTGVVKIRKGLAVKMMLQTNSMEELYYWFYVFAEEILKRAQTLRSQQSTDPSLPQTIAICQQVIATTKEKALTFQLTLYATRLMYTALVIVVAVVFFLAQKVIVPLATPGAYSIDLARLVDPTQYTSPVDQMTVVMFFTSVAMVFGYGYVSAGRTPALKKAD